MRREIRNLTEIRHPNIPTIHGYRVVRGYILGLYIDKYDVTLHQMLEQKMQFDKEQFFRSVCAIVAAIHAQRYVHADIHRGNIMVKSDNPDEPFVIDFDSAERIGSEISRQSKYINYLQNKIFEPKVDMVFLLSLRKQHQLDGSILAYYGGYTHATGCNIDTCGLTTGDAMDRVC